MRLYHRAFAPSVLWRVEPGRGGGVIVEGEDLPRRTRGRPLTAERILELWGDEVVMAAGDRWVHAHSLALLVATVATETGARAIKRIADGEDVIDVLRRRVRHEPGFVSGDETPHRISAGLCHTLLSTARALMPNPIRHGFGRVLELADLLRPALSLELAARYMIRSEVGIGDPVLVAAAYNAGAVYRERSASNPWRLRCWRPEDGEHITRFVAFYGDACAVLGGG